MTDPRNTNGNRRRKLRARHRAIGAPCHICGLPIDYGLNHLDPCAYALDELVPVSKGGDPYSFENTAPAHRCCNGWKSAKSMRDVERTRGEVLRRFGRWVSPQQFVARAKLVKTLSVAESAVEHSRAW